MDEDLSIINTNTRNEKIKNFFVNNKKMIISIIVILLFILFSVFSYDKYLLKKKKDISDKFNSIILDYSEKNKDKTANILIQIINMKDPTYSPLSLYFIIDNNLVNNQSKINSLFDVLIKDTSLDTEIKNLIIYKKALYNADNIRENELLNILKPIINSKSIWKSHALFLMAEYFYSNNQIGKSKEFYDEIMTLENSNPDIAQQTKKKIKQNFK